MGKLKKKNSGGRPTVMTPQVVQKLEEAFAMGCTDVEACLFAGIARSTLANYQRGKSEFLDRKEALKQTPILMARKVVIEAFKKDPNLAFKYLERKKKDEFSLTTGHHISGGIDQKIKDDSVKKELLEAVRKIKQAKSETVS